MSVQADMPFGPPEPGPLPIPDADARAWLAARGADTGHHLAGRYVGARRPGRHVVRHATTGEELIGLPDGDADEAAAAVAAALEAGGAWSAAGGDARAAALSRLARNVAREDRLLALLIAMETGTAMRSALGAEVASAGAAIGASAVRAPLAALLWPDATPYGTCAVLLSGRAALAEMAAMAGPALAAGNTVIAVASVESALAALCLSELAVRAGLPPAALQVLVGGPKTAAHIAAHPGVALVCPSGSADSRRDLVAAAAASGKELRPLPCAPATVIVLDDADLDGAADAIVATTWTSPPPTVRGARLLVQESVADALRGRLRARMTALRIGDALDLGTEFALPSAPSRHERYARAMRAAGTAPELVAGTGPSGDVGPDGPLPTLFVTPGAAQSLVASDDLETLAVELTFRTPAEAAALSRHGPASRYAVVFGSDLEVTLDLAGRLRAGSVTVNGRAAPCAEAFCAGRGAAAWSPIDGERALEAFLRPPFAPAVPPSPSASGEARAAVRGAAGRQEGLPTLGDCVRASSDSPWPDMHSSDRAAALTRLADTLEERADALGAAVALRSGRSRDGVAAEARAAALRWRAWAAWAVACRGAVELRTAADGSGTWMAVSAEDPWRVVGLVLPDGPPLLSLAAIAGPLLASGNVVVAVTAGTVALPPDEVAGLLAFARLPGGTLQLVVGPIAALAGELAADPAVSAVWCAAGGEALRTARQAASSRLVVVVPIDAAIAWRPPGPTETRALLDAAVRRRSLWLPRTAGPGER